MLNPGSLWHHEMLKYFLFEARFCSSFLSNGQHGEKSSSVDASVVLQFASNNKISQQEVGPLCTCVDNHAARGLFVAKECNKTQLAHKNLQPVASMVVTNEESVQMCRRLQDGRGQNATMRTVN